jgi:EpsI family protein
MYSYGLLIPFISLYMVWKNRSKVLTTRRQPNYWWGLSITIAGLSILYAGHVGNIYLIQEFSMIVTIIGIVVSFGGKPLLRVLSFPVAYLVLMVPFWENVTERISFPFQLYTARMGVGVLNLLGVPGVQYDQFIQIPNITLEVAKACSGLDYLIAIVSIGIPLSIFYVSGFLRKVSVIVIAVMIAILSNPLRVALIGLFSYHSIGNSFFGPFHILQGFFVSIVGYVVLFLSVSLLGRAASQPESSTIGVEGSQNSRSRFFSSSLLLVFILLVFGSLVHAYEPRLVPMKSNLDSFSPEIDEWRLINSNSDFHFFNGGPDLEVTKAYSDPEGNEAYIYIAYWEYQKQGREFIVKKPAELYEKSISARIPMGDRDYEVRKSIWQNNGKTMTAYTWFLINGRIINNRYLARLYTIFDSLISNKSNGSMIIVFFDKGKKNSNPDRKSMEERFLKSAFLLNRYLSN